MASWLKLIGSAKAPITEAPFHGDYTAEHVGFRKAIKPGIRAGDHLFLYAPGGSRHIFALAEAFRGPERDPNYDPDQEGSCQWRVPVHYLINLPVASGISIDDIDSGQRDVTQSIRQASHIKLLPEESDTARRKLEAARGREVEEPEAAPIAVSHPFVVGEPYTRKDVRRLLGLEPEEIGGVWSRGHVRHEGDWFVFVNIESAGATGHNYHNHWIDGRLHWSASQDRQLKHESIQSLLKSRVFIFTREDIEEPFVFRGIGVPEDVKDKPVQIVWRFETARADMPPAVRVIPMDSLKEEFPD